MTDVLPLNRLWASESTTLLCATAVCWYTDVSKPKTVKGGEISLSRPCRSDRALIGSFLQLYQVTSVEVQEEVPVYRPTTARRTERFQSQRVYNFWFIRNCKTITTLWLFILFFHRTGPLVDMHRVLGIWSNICFLWLCLHLHYRVPSYCG